MSHRSRRANQRAHPSLLARRIARDHPGREAISCSAACARCNASRWSFCATAFAITATSCATASAPRAPCCSPIPTHIRHVLHDNHRNYDKQNVDYAMLRRLLGNGLLTSDGAFWRRQRRLIAPMFHRQRVAGFCT